MLGLLIFIIIIALGLYGLNEYYKIRLGVTHIKTPKGAMESLANLIEDTNIEEGRLLHLGSGTGGFVLGMARRLPNWDIIGVEQSPTPWVLANLRTIGNQLKNYRFYLDDTIQWPLKNYDIIFLSHDEKTLRRWEQSLARRLQPESLLISYNNKLPRIAPSNTITIDQNTTFYVYQRRPAVVETAPTPAVPLAPTPEQIAEQTAAETIAERAPAQPAQSELFQQEVASTNAQHETVPVREIPTP